MPSAASIYVKLASSAWGRPRPLIRRFLEDFDCSPGLYIIKLPTGYGKTGVVYAQALATLLGECSSSTLYVAPLRSLVDDVYYRWKVAASEVLSERLLSELSGVQHAGATGSVYMNKPVVFTTLDTLLLHLFKLPPPELRHYAKAMASDRSYRGHYEVSRGAIANSLVVLDEPHLTIHSAAMIKALLAALRFLAYVRSVVVLMTATMPHKLEELVRRSVRGYLGGDGIVRYCYGEDGLVDEDFEEEQLGKDVRTELALDRELGAEDVARAAEEYGRVLVVVNRRVRAVDLYREVKGLLARKGLDDRLFLLHGFMVEGERRRVTERVRELSARRERFVLITTQVIEAGFDVSSDALLTELAPPPSLVQRAGRVARWGESEGVVRIYGVGERGPYADEDLRLAREALEHSGRVLWRALRPRSCNECLDYAEFVERATIVSEVKMSEVYNVADYVSHPAAVAKLLLDMLRGNLLREAPLLVSLYVKGRLEHGSIPVDFNTLAGLVRDRRIVGYVTSEGKEVVGGEAGRLVDPSDPVKTWLELMNIKGLLLSEEAYEELAYGSR